MRRNTWMILLGALVLVIGMAIIALSPADRAGSESTLISIGVVMIVVGFVRNLRQRDGIVKDERTRKIADRSAAYSWVLTLLVLMAAYWLNRFGAVAFTVDGIIATTYVTMVATMIGFQQYYARRGDTE